MTKKKPPLRKGQRVRLAPRKVEPPLDLDQQHGEAERVVAGLDRSWDGRKLAPGEPVKRGAMLTGGFDTPRAETIKPAMPTFVPEQDFAGCDLSIKMRDPLKEQSVAGKLEKLAALVSQETGDAKRVAHGARAQVEWAQKDARDGIEAIGKQLNAMSARIEALELAVHGELRGAGR